MNQTCGDYEVKSLIYCDKLNLPGSFKQRIVCCQTEEKMLELIKFWISEYEGKRYVRFAIWIKEE
jgi:hypothetical protein